MCKETKLTWVYGHIPNDLTYEFWDKKGWTWHQIPVDACLANMVEILNQQGIFTLASCCGHHQEKGEIAISEEAVDLAKTLRYNVDRGSDNWPYTIIPGD